MFCKQAPPICGSRLVGARSRYKNGPVHGRPHTKIQSRGVLVDLEQRSLLVSHAKSRAYRNETEEKFEGIRHDSCKKRGHFGTMSKCFTYAYRPLSLYEPPTPTFRPSRNHWFRYPLLSPRVSCKGLEGHSNRVAWLPIFAYRHTHHPSSNAIIGGWGGVKLASRALVQELWKFNKSHINEKEMKGDSSPTMSLELRQLNHVLLSQTS